MVLWPLAPCPTLLHRLHGKPSSLFSPLLDDLCPCPHAHAYGLEVGRKFPREGRSYQESSLPLLL